MDAIREPAVAGLFYPADSAVLERMLDTCMRDRCEHPAGVTPALVVPHAGLPFSGAVAASAYALLTGTPAPRRVALLGPSHRVAFDGLALSSAHAFRTPFGDLAVDYPAGLEALAGVQVLDAAHAAEHSLEVQLPFLQRLWGEQARIAPLVVGECGAGQVADVIEHLMAEQPTLLLLSTDLSHFHDYDSARRIDAGTVAEIEALHATLEPQQACGCRPLNGLIEYCRRHGHGLQKLDVRNSGDTAGGRDRVVGYGAFHLQ